MGSSPDNFESLEKLLRLKRHEQPPPRYFNEFSGRVLARIERGDGHLSWWERFGFDLRPALAASAGLVACGLIVYGVATTDGDTVPLATTGPSFAMQTAQPVALRGDGEKTLTANSTNPVAAYGTPGERRLFSPQVPVVPVSFLTQ